MYEDNNGYTTHYIHRGANWSPDTIFFNVDFINSVFTSTDQASYAHHLSSGLCAEVGRGGPGQQFIIARYCTFAPPVEWPTTPERLRSPCRRVRFFNHLKFGALLAASLVQQLQ